MANFLGFPTPPRTAPFQIPESNDPAQIILQAAGLQRQDEALKQKAAESANESLLAALSLLERKRQGDIEKLKAEATIEFTKAQAEIMRKRSAFIGETTAETSMIPTTEDEGPELVEKGDNIFQVIKTPKGKQFKILPRQRLRPQDSPDRLLSANELALYPSLKSGATVKDTFGLKPLTSESRKELHKTDTAISLVSQIRSYFLATNPPKSTGNAAIDTARLSVRGIDLGGQSLFPNTKAGLYASSVNSRLGVIARQFSGEVGVLTDQDIFRIKQALPTFRDTVESGEKKIQSIYDILKYAQVRLSNQWIGPTLSNANLTKKQFLKALLEGGVSESLALEKIKEFKHVLK